MDRQPVLLLIFDGFGLNSNRAHNGWSLARTPHLDHCFATNPHTTLDASGLAVGLPDGQFGNSEVGHLTLGSGQAVKHYLLRISEAIEDKRLKERDAWQEGLAGAERVHLVGMVSPGGVHSHQDHLFGLLSLVAEMGAEPVVHMITDGRDTPPRSALEYLDVLKARLKDLGQGRIATVSGRYYAMDRADNWERTEKAWQAMIEGKGHEAESARAAIEKAYDRDESDEFIEPTVVGAGRGLADVAPTVLDLLGLEKPPAMTGKSLIV